MASTALLTTVKTSSQNFRVAETNPRTDPRWESFVVEHPNGSIYHHPAWLEALEREYGQKGVYIVCEDAAGQVLAILPMLYTRGLPFGLGRPLAGRRLSSLPRTPVAGPLSIDSRATVALLQEAVQRASRNPGVQLQIKTQGRELDGLIDGVVCTPWRLSYVLQLAAISEGSFRVADSDHRYNIKKAINKATRLGVHVRPAETLADLRGWYVLYLDTMRRNFVPARPYRFFAALWELLRPQGMMQLLLAEQQKVGGSRIIAGTIFLRLGRTVSCAFNGSRPRDLLLRPNDIIYWEAINDACRRGFQFFDFGEVAEGRPELARYKSKWGAEPVRLYRYYHPAPRDLEIGVVESGGYAKLLIQAVWRRFPLAATAWLGDRIYARL
jgi:CelD/BcsL family acetyltransferase involved in cellulose biosynthesis